MIWLALSHSLFDKGMLHLTICVNFKGVMRGHKKNNNVKVPHRRVFDAAILCNLCVKCDTAAVH